MSGSDSVDTAPGRQSQFNKASVVSGSDSVDPLQGDRVSVQQGFCCLSESDRVDTDSSRETECQFTKASVVSGSDSVDTAPGRQSVSSTRLLL